MARVEKEHGLRIDCAKNGCNPQHDDNGEVLRVGLDQFTVNGHAATKVTRTITYSDWEES